jgi:Tol biopolymer transport system component
MVNHRKKLVRSQLRLLLLLLLPVSALSQSTDEAKNIFAKAESYYLYEEYELANQLYLLIETPENMNIKYKIGVCYLNIASEKEKSIPYLEASIKTATYDSKTESFKELKAPLDAYFSLAKAYMINNDFEKGLNTLQTFSKLVGETKSKGGMENLEFIEQQIQACKNSIQFRKVPISLSKEPLGSELTLGSINENPAVSYDGKTLVYTERRGIVNALFCSRKTGDKWQPPVEITKELNAGEDCSSCSLNKDGTELFLYKTDNYDGAIYSSTWVNGHWTPIKKLNKNINTKYYESHAAISYNGKKLYFTSNREGGQGNLDIYISEKDASGDWGPAVNIGPEINTSFNEDTPFITQNDSVLYFSSEGHNSMGGFDIFRSQKTANGWKAPSNMGSPINSPDDDKFFEPANNGKNAFYSMATGYKKKEIFYLTIGDFENTATYRITGKISLNDTILVPEKKYSVGVVNRITGDTLYKGSPDKSTGLYKLNVASGIYKLIYSGDGYFSQSIDTMIIGSIPDAAITLDVKLIKDTTRLNKVKPIKYVAIDLSKIPEVATIDSKILIKNLKVNDAGDKSIADSDVLYYTVQVMALHKPVDVSYFKYISNMKVLYNDDDRFYRYTTGVFQTKEEAYSLRSSLIAKGYPEQIFVKKISK